MCKIYTIFVNIWTNYHSCLIKTCIIGYKIFNIITIIMIIDPLSGQDRKGNGAWELRAQMLREAIGRVEPLAVLYSKYLTHRRGLMWRGVWTMLMYVIGLNMSATRIVVKPQFFLNFWYSCFELLVMSALGFACTLSCLCTIPQIHLWCDTCWPLDGHNGTQASLTSKLVATRCIHKHWWTNIVNNWMWRLTLNCTHYSSNALFCMEFLWFEASKTKPMLLFPS